MSKSVEIHSQPYRYRADHHTITIFIQTQHLYYIPSNYGTIKQTPTHQGLVLMLFCDIPRLIV